MYSEFCDNSLSRFLLTTFPSIHTLLVFVEGKYFFFLGWQWKYGKVFFPFKQKKVGFLV